MQNADELASHKDLMQVEVDALRQEMANVKEQLTEQQVCFALRQTQHLIYALHLPSLSQTGKRLCYCCVQRLGHRVACRHTPCMLQSCSPVWHVSVCAFTPALLIALPACMLQSRCAVLHKTRHYFSAASLVCMSAGIAGRPQHLVGLS